MREILVDHARSRRAAKRDYRCKITLDQAVALPQKRDVDLLAVDDALTALAGFDERKSQVVEMRFFGGLSVEETADALHVSERTVKRDWTMARLWLVREMKHRNE